MDAAQKLLRTSALVLAISLLMAAPGWAQHITRSVLCDDREHRFRQRHRYQFRGGDHGNHLHDCDPAIRMTPLVRGSWLVRYRRHRYPGLPEFRPQKQHDGGNRLGSRGHGHPDSDLAQHATAVTITVTFNGSSSGGGGGGTSNVLTANPTSATFAGTGTQVSTNITLTNTSVNTLTLSATPTTSSGGSWLSALFSTNPVNSRSAPRRSPSTPTRLA